jgi:predicted kinase
MRAYQPHVPAAEKRRLVACFRSYRRLAGRAATERGAGLMIAHGLSGSGKTTATQPLVELLGAVRLRSDLERKRMHGLGALAASKSAPGGRHLFARGQRYHVSAPRAARAGDRPCRLSGRRDAAFLRRSEREAFRALAARLEVPFLILNFRAPLTLLRARVAARSAQADDASEADGAVLERQITACEPLTPAEIAASVVLDTTRRPSRKSWRRILDKRRLTGRTGIPPSRLTAIVPAQRGSWVLLDPACHRSGTRT